MQQKQRVFIYDRKEMGVLTLLGVMVAVFAFTLGVHLGKKVPAPKTAGPAHETAPVATVPDTVPEPRDLHEQAKGVEKTADEALSQSLRDEVGKVGVKTEKTVQVELPRKPKAKNAGATSLSANSGSPVSGHDRVKRLETLSQKLENEERNEQNHELTEDAKAEHDSAASENEAKSGTHFSLQIGSYPVLADAKSRIQQVSKAGLKPFLREAEVKGRGRWYRVYLGEFATKVEAEKAGMKYRSDHVIESFIVAKLAAPVTTD